MKPFNYQIVCPVCTKYYYKMYIVQNSLGNLWSRQLPCGVCFDASVSQFLETCSQRRTDFLITSSAVLKPTSDMNDLYSIYDEVACIIVIIIIIIIIITADDISLIPHVSGGFVQQLHRFC